MTEKNCNCQGRLAIGRRIGVSDDCARRETRAAPRSPGSAAPPYPELDAERLERHAATVAVVTGRNLRCA
jgi:hypothetical protein